MNAMRILRKYGLHVFVPVLLSLLPCAPISGAAASNDFSDISKEERAALKDKACSTIMVEYGEKNVPLERIARLLAAKLKDESLLESLSKLQEQGPHSDVSTAVTEGRLIYRTGIPLPKDSDGCANELLRILNNARFVKLIQELPAMPKAEMAALVTKEIETSLAQYDKSYNFHFEIAVKHYDSVKNDRKGKVLVPAFLELRGLRHRVLALLFIAGHLQLRESQAMVEKIVDYAVRQRDKLYDQNLFEYDFASVMLDRETLYHRQILGSALLGTCLTPNEAQQVLADIGAKYQDRKLKPYDQMLSVVHAPFERKALRLLDDREGKIGIRLVEPLDDSQFNRLAEAAKNARQQGGVPKKDAPGPASNVQENEG